MNTGWRTLSAAIALTGGIWHAPLCHAQVAAPAIKTAAPAATKPSLHDLNFRKFIEGLRPESRAMGVSDQTFDTAFRGLEPDRSLPDLLLPGQKRPGGPGQAEFTKTPLEYLGLASLTNLAGQGRQLAQRHATTLAGIERELGVDRHILLAIWGRETAFGTYKLPHPIVRVLATQAYLGRRKETFRKELLFALKMIEDGILKPDVMKASWAGAIGLTQFLPSEYYDLAYDMDKDGKKDIWNSIPDALASAANQLKAKGWTPGQPWGYEVRLPASTTCLAEGQPNARPASDWVKAGVVRADGKPIPQPRLSEPAFLLTPGGSYGPVFLVFENFMVLKRYNFADLYAVFVGHLADRLAGGGDFQTKWTTPRMLSVRELEEIQERLKSAGYPVEKVDGKAGMNTRSLIGKYQQANSLAVDCWPAAPLLDHMRRTAQR
jgi:lytic murein transglycosylase